MLKRTHSLFLVLFVLSVLCTSFFAAAPAFACSCALPPDALTARDQSDAVFSGKVLDVKEAIDWSDFMPFTKPIRMQLEVILEVQSTWKGVTTSQVEINTAPNGAGCGVDFQPGKVYLVYASYGEDNGLFTHLCTRTSELANASDDLLALGQGSPPGEPVDLIGQKLLLSYGLPAAFLVAVLVVSVFLFRKKRGRS